MPKDPLPKRKAKTKSKGNPKKKNPTGVINLLFKKKK